MEHKDVLKFTAVNGQLIVLRQAKCPDAEGIISIIKTSGTDRSYVLMEYYGAKPDAVISYICSMDFDKNLLLVAEAGTEVVGALSAIQSDKGERKETAHNLSVGLHLIPAYRGLGIGTKMLDFAIDWAHEHKFKKLEANIFTSNERSLHIFERAGFSEEGRRRKRIRLGKHYIDEVLLGKLL